MKKILKIVHVLEGLEEGGILTFLENLINSTPNTQHTIIYGLRDSHYLSQTIIKRFRYPNVSFIYWKYAKREIHVFRDLFAMVKLYLILKEFSKQDVFHLHSSKAGLIGRIVCLIQGKRKVVYTPHGIAFLSAKFFFRKFALKSIEKVASFLPSKIVCVSASESHELRKMKIRSNYINNGLKYEKKMVKPLSTKFIIVNTGRIIYQKNPNTFNQIAKHYEAEKSVHFVWIGDGLLKQELTSSNIEITGWLPKKDLLDILMKSSVYLSTSHYEGLSFSVLEAMSIGLPLVLSRCVGNKDLVNNNGYLFKKPQNAIEYIDRLRANPNELKSLGRASRKFFIDSFKIQKCVNKYIHLYQSFYP